MVSGSQGSAQKKRAERERARVYEARAQVHAERVTRRRRDSVLAAIIGGIIVIAAIVAQSLYFTVGPGIPEPTATSTPSPSTEITPIPEPSVTVDATPDATPTP